MKRLIDFSGLHKTVLGTTGTGKTWGVAASVASLNRPVIWINTTALRWDKFPTVFRKRFVNVDGGFCMDEIVQSLKGGYKLLYKMNYGYKDNIIKYMADKLLDAGFTQEKPVYLVVDEIHLYKKQGLSELERVVTTGRAFGVCLIAISQRPALVSNTIMTQSDGFVMFETSGMECQYFRGYNIPQPEINERIRALSKYAYCEWDYKEIKGAFVVE